MRILLIHPQNHLHSYKSGIYKKPLRYACLTMPTLAGLIPANIKAEIKIVDEMVESLDESIEVDLVGISAITPTANKAYEIADKFRKRGVPVVLGGIHPTLMPEESILHANSVIIGYAEKSWPQLLEDFEKGKMKKFYCQSDSFSLNNISLPRRDLTKQSAYMTNNTLEATRGCPNKCEFCIFQGFKINKYYKKPIDEVLYEVSQIKGKSMVFLDANLIGEKDYAKELFRRMIPFKKWWIGAVTVELTKDKELFDLIVRSGCKGVLIGFESLSQQTLDKINKSFNSVQEYKEIVKELHSHGIAIHGSFVFGFEDDTPKTFQDVLEFVNEAKIDFPQYTLYTPFPGTPVYNKLKKEGRIITNNWSLYNGQNCVFKPNRITPHDLEKGLQWIQRQTYSLNYILKRVNSKPYLLKPIILLINLLYGYYTRRIPLVQNRIKGDKTLF